MDQIRHPKPSMRVGLPHWCILLDASTGRAMFTSIWVRPCALHSGECHGGVGGEIPKQKRMGGTRRTRFFEKTRGDRSFPRHDPWDCHRTAAQARPPWHHPWPFLGNVKPPYIRTNLRGTHQVTARGSVLTPRVEEYEQRREQRRRLRGVFGPRSIRGAIEQATAALQDALHVHLIHRLRCHSEGLN